MRRRPAVTAIALLAVLGLSACSAEGEPAPEQTTEAPAATIEPGSVEPEGAVALTGAIEDEDLGHLVSVSRVVRDAVIPGAEDLADGGEIVLVEVTLTGGSAYQTRVRPASLSFANPPAASGAEDPELLSEPVGVQLPEADAAMVAAGYVVLSADGAGVGETVTGWTAFRIAATSDPTATPDPEAEAGAEADPLVLRYTRPAQLGTDGETFAATAWEVDLVEGATAP
jgi:hypothetical protein